ATAEEAIARCQSLRVQLAASEVEGIHITVSMGIAHWQGEWHFDSLFSRADDALYRAKREGKNRVCQAA
ncbi:diguanylate cyclase, partial [Escherichia coli]|nr:diguanylate cyclase [Escherichia coli]